MRSFTLLVAVTLVAWPSFAGEKQTGPSEPPAKKRILFHLNCEATDPSEVAKSIRVGRTYCAPDFELTVFIDLAAIPLADSSKKTLDERSMDEVNEFFSLAKKNSAKLLVCPFCA
ncbi:MAG: hypothetical protein U1D30_01730, partial [Planctomycetota bacterium]